MQRIDVHTASAAYPILFARDFAGLGAALEEAGIAGGKVCVITDETVAPLYLKQVREALLPVFAEVSTYAFPAGEHSKTLDTVQGFYDFFLMKHADRKTVVVGLGGGVAGDMAGFAAASFMRGIPYVQVPTTLLAQVDSSVGGKVGVDYRGVKNLVGAFYQPKLVYINSQTLRTLPPREYAAGMAEVVKYGLILSADFYGFLTRHIDAVLAQEPAVLDRILADCCAMKAEVVAQDEKEGGLREILNFGHTVGHAVESLLGFALLHGECVALGMVSAMVLSGLDPAPLKQLLQALELPVTVSGLTAEEIYSQMFLDKKVKQNRLSFVLLSEIGRAYRTTEKTKEEIIAAIEAIL